MNRRHSVHGLDPSLRWDDHEAAVRTNRQAHSASHLFHAIALQGREAWGRSRVAQEVARAGL